MVPSLLGLQKALKTWLWCQAKFEVCYLFNGPLFFGGGLLIRAVWSGLSDLMFLAVYMGFFLVLYAAHIPLAGQYSINK